MTVIKPRNQNNCGYGTFATWGKEFSLSDNIKKIHFRNDVNGNPIKTVKVENFDNEAIPVASAYNPPKIRTILTPVSGGHALISNMEINGKTVQFICVDGKRLSEWEFENPDIVINNVNTGKLTPIVLRDIDNISSNEMTMVDAYAGSIWYCLFLWEIFERVAIIDDSQVFLSVVNINMANAFWNSHYMTYGNGNQPGAPKMGALTSIDVVGHESGHGIIEALGNLTYQGESGALNESIADIFGTCLEKYYDIRAQKNLFDWDMGEDFMVGGMRSLSNPKSHDQPDTYQGKNWADPYGNFDNGGVHINSGVNNYFFYSVTTGASGKNDNGVEYNVSKTIPIFSLAKLIYLSLKGAPGYRKITADVNYSQYTECLLSNYQHYLETNDSDSGLGESILEGLVAVGLQTRKPLPPDNGGDSPKDGDDSDDPNPESPVPPPHEPGTRRIVWTTNFGADSPFYTYGVNYRTPTGLLVLSGSETVATFILTGLNAPVLHITGNFGSNSLSVQFDVGGKVYQHMISGNNSAAIEIPGSDYSRVVVILKPITNNWWPNWSHLHQVAISAI